MSITISPDGKHFHIATANTSYIAGVGKTGYFDHNYYGAKLFCEPDVFQNAPDGFWGISFCPYRGDNVTLEARHLAAQECTTFALGDYRTASVAVRDSLGCNTTDPQFVSARVYSGRPEIADMPCARVNGDPSVETLEVTLRDPATGIEYVLDYTVFPAQDCIVRSMLIRNPTDRTAVVERAMSFCLDLESRDLDLIQCQGTYARERYGFERTPLHAGNQGFFSSRNSSGADHNPAFALAGRNATEDSGDVYGAFLIYSGSFRVDIEVDSFCNTRVMAGIDPDSFEWTLEPGDSFRTPEAVLTFSAEGIGGMSRNCHDFLREHLISPRWSHAERPILINNWEGTGMQFDREKLLAIAAEGAKLGMDMFVLDDGWFGHRDNDRSSLGDWFVYGEKVGSLRTLAEEVNAMGLKFGLWFEPEMISEDSELHKAHPEWVFTAPGRERTYGRHQCVLNMGMPEVVDYLFDVIAKILADVPVYYMKWDMNRQPAEIWNPLLPASRQKEASHRYVLGVYELHRRLLERFPDLLIEGCSGGGGRFDAGILYYAPQIWTSDNTDAFSRLYIQGGTSLVYPLSAQGAHVTANANAPLEARFAAAIAGTFGYELDLTTMSGEMRQQVPEQIRRFRAIRHLVSDGDFYRLQNVWEGDGCLNVWEFASKDRQEALMISICSKRLPGSGRRRIRLRGLDPEKQYRLENSDFVCSGDFLMKVGIAQRNLCRAGEAEICHFTAIG